jgi:hypothetical protein
VALIGKEIANEYNFPVRMSVEIFLNRHTRKKATRKFLRRFGNSRRNRTVLQGQDDETGRHGRADYILDGIPKRIDIIRRVQI